MTDKIEKKESSELTTKSDQLVGVDNIELLIKIFRGQQVMLDRDLATLYGVETKRLNEQVKRNIKRFPEDFMFQLTKDECLRSQIATLNEGRGQHLKYMPYVFTENGVAMLSSVLRSDTAIEVNIRIMRAFTSMRHFLQMEIHSPGALPNGLTIDDIKAGTSMPRNTFLFNNAIYLLPYTGVGSGITRALDEDINVTFMNNDKAQEFVITVWRGESNQVDGESNQVQDSDTRLRHSDTPKVSLSNKQRDIVNFCSVPRTTKEILDRIGVSMHSKNRERYITSLVAAGYLQMTNPDNPTASNQKYKKVNKR